MQRCWSDCTGTWHVSICCIFPGTIEKKTLSVLPFFLSKEIGLKERRKNAVQARCWEPFICMAWGAIWLPNHGSGPATYHELLSDKGHAIFLYKNGTHCVGTNQIPRRGGAGIDHHLAPMETSDPPQHEAEGSVNGAQNPPPRQNL